MLEPEDSDPVTIIPDTTRLNVAIFHDDGGTVDTLILPIIAWRVIADDTFASAEPVTIDYLDGQFWCVELADGRYSRPNITFDDIDAAKVEYAVWRNRKNKNGGAE